MRALPSLLTILGLLALARPARADVVWNEPCPWGARERTSHAGPRCAPWPCSSDAECEDGRVCRPWRVCTQTFSVAPAGRGAFRDPPPPPTMEEQVVAACEPAQQCDGDETPRPPTTGTATGAVQCREATYCVRPSFPPLPSDAPPAAPPPPSVPAPTGSTVAAPDQPAASTCSCRVQRGGSEPPLTVLALALALSLARRRRR